MPILPLIKAEPLTNRQRLIRLAILGLVGTQVVTTVFVAQVIKKVIKE